MADSGYTLGPKPDSGGYQLGPKPEAPSFLSGVGAGLADKFYGAAQIGAHMPPLPPEQPLAPPDVQTDYDKRTQEVDATVRKREADLKAQGYNTGWGRTVGNLLGDLAVTAPLMAAAPVAGGMMGGAGIGAAGGALTSALQPVTGGNFAKEKAEQIAGGTTSGAVLGGSLGALSKAISADSPAQVESFIKDNFTRAIKPTVAGKSTASQAERYGDQAFSAVKSIVDNKANLSFTDEAGRTITGQLPRTIDQFSEAIEQTKKTIFEKYDALAQGAEMDIHRAAEMAAKQRLAQAQNKLTQATARQSVAGNVYSSSAANQAVREAQGEVRVAQVAVERASSKANATRDIVRQAGGDTATFGSKIPTKSIAETVRGLADSKALQISEPHLRDEIRNLADRLNGLGDLTATETQDIIQHLNAELKSFYRNPTMETTSMSVAKALMANKLRSVLDETIEKTVSPGYQALKNQYGALKAIEKDVVHRAIVDARQPKGGGIIDRLANIASVEEAVRAIADPSALVRAAAIKGAQMTTRYLKSPNRAITRLFEAAEKPAAPPPSAAMQFAWPAGAATGGGMVGDMTDRVMGLQ